MTFGGWCSRIKVARLESIEIASKEEEEEEEEEEELRERGRRRKGKGEKTR